MTTQPTSDNPLCAKCGQAQVAHPLKNENPESCLSIVKYYCPDGSGNVFIPPAASKTPEECAVMAYAAAENRSSELAEELDATQQSLAGAEAKARSHELEFKNFCNVAKLETKNKMTKLEELAEWIKTEAMVAEHAGEHSVEELKTAFAKGLLWLKDEIHMHKQSKAAAAITASIKEQSENQVAKDAGLPTQIPPNTISTK